MGDVEATTKGNQDHQDMKESYENRKVKHPTTYLQTLMHFLKGCLGTGILAMPSAFQKAGLLVGLPASVITGFLCIYTVHMLVHSEEELSRRRKVRAMTYHATWQSAFEDGPQCLRWLAPYAASSTKFLFLFGLMGSASVYVLFISSNLKAVVDEYQHPNERMHVRWYILMTWIPLTLLGWIRDLKYLAPFSAVGTASSIVSYGIVGHYMFQDLPSVSSRDAFGSWGGLPQFFSIAIFAMESIATVMPLKKEMRRPEQFGSPLGVLNVAMVLDVALFAAMGFFGYLKYGNQIEPSISLNLPDGEILARVSRLLIILSITLSHSLNMYISCDIAWNEFIERRVKKNKCLAEYALRTFLVLASVIAAAIVPYLDLVMSLLGSLLLTTLGIMFPVMIEQFTWWYKYHGIRFFLWSCKNGLFFLVGVAGLIIGTTTAMNNIIKKTMES